MIQGCVRSHGRLLLREGRGSRKGIQQEMRRRGKGTQNSRGVDFLIEFGFIDISFLYNTQNFG